MPPSWTPFRRSCRCRLGCPTALCDAPPGGGRAGSAGQTHLRTLDRSDSAKPGEDKQGVLCFRTDQHHGFFWMLGWLVTDLLLLVQHDMRLEAGDAGEPFIADRAGEVGGCVRGLVEREVKLHVERLRAVVTSVRLPGTDDTLTISQAVSSSAINSLHTSGHNRIQSFQGIEARHGQQKSCCPTAFQEFGITLMTL